MRHCFNLDGGDDLTTMGAAWFVSYSYHEYVDSNHLNWRSVTTWKNRQSVYCKTDDYHRYWLNEILKMNESNLNKNTIGINGYEVKRMARQVLERL